MNDVRLQPPAWDPSPRRRTEVRVRLLGLVFAPLVVWYFGWLLDPQRVGHPVLYAVLIAAELFNALQAIGFWWTCARGPRRRPRGKPAPGTPVDVLVPTYDEPLEVVAPTVAAAVRLPGAQVTVCDDGGRKEVARLARRLGASYIARPGSEGAKAGNLNYALARTDAPFVAVLDCDHVPRPEFLERTLGYFVDPRVALVQTPQYYANHARGSLARAAWSQQALFFGPIARGKDGLDAMFCCGTNVVFRRSALEEAGGFPQDSLTEDFELSVRLHERGYRTVYVPEVLCLGLGPEDMAAYVGQQQRWARGCLSALPAVLRARLPRRLRLQYLLSAMYFLSGWTVVVYMSLPVIRILTGAQPLAEAGADDFLVHFAPYFGMALVGVAQAGAGTYTFGAFALAAANFWVHVYASLVTALRVPGRFVVTPKRGRTGRQPRAVAPALVAIAVLGAACVVGLASDRSPATLNNVAFACLHIAVLGAGAWPALSGAAARQVEEEPVREAAA